MGGESCTVLRLRLMCKLAMPHIVSSSFVDTFNIWSICNNIFQKKIELMVIYSTKFNTTPFSSSI